MNHEKCRAIIARDRRVIPDCQHNTSFPLAIERANGAILEDADGNRYIDFLASSASLNLGSCHPVVAEAIEAQLKRYTQYGIYFIYNGITVDYAERLVSVFPGEGPAKIAFGNSGSDAADAAIKFARAYTGRPKIISFIDGYHGNTLASASLTFCSSKTREKYGPMVPDIYPFRYYGTDRPDEEVERCALQDIALAFETYLPPEEVAAVIVEPIQGDSGILPAHPLFMKKLGAMCKKHGILFISDETQQGFWRTGKFFGIEHYDVKPDGIIIGKAMGAGLVMSGFMARSEIMDSLYNHSFTLSGNALSCAAGIAAFDYYQTAEFQNQLQEHIRTLEEEAAKLKARYPDNVIFTRNIGMSMGIGVGRPDVHGRPVLDNDAAFKIVYRSFERGLVMIPLAGHVLRIQPPLVITSDEIREGFSIIGKSIEDLNAGRIGDEVLCNRKH